ncbi:MULTISPECIES: sigma-70 family RNA polymerase sigma factor [unclassified Roseitalea]|uniref:RNA polymerase sigma factor n=1 Tax=unclassified Roseitalea TaxID=2639107 RepID=UPI00273E6741|nr:MULTISPECIES: sigma-70 family RNA polymerase sigma factor [unclassified Roseitalea]
MTGTVRVSELADDREDAAEKPPCTAVRRALEESHGQISSFLQRRLGSAEDAEEVLQAFVLRAVERAHQLEDVASVRGWLSRILATSIADHHRRVMRRRRRETSVDPHDLAEVSVEPDAEIDEAICNCLYKLLPTLKGEYAEVIWRIDLLEEPRERVAAALGLTLNNLSVRLHRGRQALKRRLQEMCLTCPVHGFLDCDCEAAERARRRQPSDAAASRGRNPDDPEDEAR